MARSTTARHEAVEGIRGAMDARELFWNNVIRDILMSLSVMKVEQTQAVARETAKLERAERRRLKKAAETGHAPAGLPTLKGTVRDEQARQDAEAVEEDEENEEEMDALPPFDGRLAVITTHGVRIVIEDVYPLFACSMPGTDLSRELSSDVQCTVFQIRTPKGEIYTLPVQEIRSFHSLSAELMERIERRAARQRDKSGTPTEVPFGLAAYTSLARSAHLERLAEEEDQRVRAEPEPDERTDSAKNKAQDRAGR